MEQLYSKQQKRARRMLYRALNWYRRPIKLCKIHQRQDWQHKMLAQMFQDGILGKIGKDRIYLTDKGLQLAYQWFPGLKNKESLKRVSEYPAKYEVRTYFVKNDDDSKEIPRPFKFLVNIDMDYGTYDLIDDWHKADWSNDWRDKKRMKQVFPEVCPYVGLVVQDDVME